jgi:hypothetical protein
MAGKGTEAKEELAVKPGKKSPLETVLFADIIWNPCDWKNPIRILMLHTVRSGNFCVMNRSILTFKISCS